ncbi:MAG TPA: shikimate dehydrogenase [Clostridia bacterium]|nr:shikimate dehydrogenase [Clostridia bacterium]
MPEFSGDLRVFGIIGYPLSHSLSPLMQRAAFLQLGLKHEYVPFQVQPRDLPGAVEGARALGLAGFNVTIPFKEAILPLLDELSGEAILMGAVNTVVNRSGRLWGYNTDGRGFLLSLEKELGMKVQGKEALLLGAGGAARAVAFALAREKVSRLTIANRTGAKAIKLARDLSSRTGIPVEVCGLDERELSRFLSAAHLLVNTSPLGMYPNRDALPPVPVELLQPPLVVYDLIYNPLQTRLLKMASQKGCRTLNGLGMLVYQGAESFRVWTGQPGPVEIMRLAVEKALEI